MYLLSLDIVEGNTKSIMRLILALAAHFKPNSVKQSSHARVQRGDTMAGIAQVCSLLLSRVVKLRLTSGMSNFKGVEKNLYLLSNSTAENCNNVWISLNFPNFYC